MRVLLVAPRTNLLLADEEVQDVVNSGLDVARLLQGEINQVELTREIRRGNFDVLWFCTHGTEQGVQLSDGLLTISALTQLVRGRFNLVVLNSCSSVYAAQQIQNETTAAVVCTIVEIPDMDAYRTGSLFAHALARLGDSRAAYEQSKPGGNRLYLYLAGAAPRTDFLAEAKAT